jgi:hypothetical protein
MKINTINKENLVGYWSLAEADTLNGSVKDLSGNGNDGVIAVTPATFVSDQNGVSSQAMSFDGVGTEITEFNPTGFTDKITITGWIKYNDNADYQIMVSNDSYTALEFRTSNSDYLDFYINGVKDTNTENILITGNWYFVCGVYDGTNIITYVNGLPSAGSAQTGNIPIVAGHWTIGRRYDAGFWNSNTISDVAIYSSALTPEQVSQLYKAGRTTAKMKVDATDLLAGWDFTSGWGTVGATIIDLNSFSTIGDGGIYKTSIGTTIGRTYKLVFKATSTQASGRIIGANTGPTPLIGHWDTGILSEYTFVATSENIFIRNSGAGTTDITTFELVDITNAITPKLQKGLILDMPLQEPYTEAGDVTNDLSTLFNTDSWSTSNANIVSDTEFNVTADNGLISKSNFWSSNLANKHYKILLDGTLTGSILTIRSSGQTVSYDGDKAGGTSISSLPAVIDVVVLTNLADNIVFQLPTSGGSLSLAQFEVLELDGTTKDRTPNGNDGTVSGATIKYDGLVNTVAGVAYIPLSRQNIYQFRAKHQDTGATYTFASQNIFGSEGYGLRLNTDGKLQLLEDGVMIDETAASYLVDNTDYQFKTTWSLSGEFNVYIRGGSYGWDSWTLAITHADTTYSDAYYFVVNATAYCMVSDLQVL